MRYLMVALLAIAGCAERGTDTGNPGAAPQLPDTCNAAAYQNLVGQDAVSALIVPDPKRVYRLGDPITQDYIPNRVNVKLDDTDVIIAVDCG